MNKKEEKTFLGMKGSLDLKRRFTAFLRLVFTCWDGKLITVDDVPLGWVLIGVGLAGALSFYLISLTA